MSTSLLDVAACDDDQDERVEVVVEHQRFKFLEEHFDEVLSRSGAFVEKNGAAKMRSIRSLADLKDHCDSILIQEIDQLAEICQLTKTQKRKILLAARGDVAHLIDQLTRLRKKCTDSELSQAEYAKCLEDIQSLASVPTTLAFDESSLFRKVLWLSLTPEQKEAYQSMKRQGQVESVEHVLNMLSRAYFTGRLSKQTREQIIEILLTNAEVPNHRHPYVLALVLLEISALETQLRPLLSESQWQELQAGIASAKRMEPSLRSMGIWPIPRLNDETE